MSYFIVEPEVAGHLGSGTVMDRSSHPPIISALEYVFDGWQGDPLLESFPCFILRLDLFERFRKLGMTGFSCSDVKVDISEEFSMLFEGVDLPRFGWLRVSGRGGDDFALLADGRLAVSTRALQELLNAGMKNADVTPISM